MEKIRKRIVFHGNVQGVGFRFRSRYLAQSLGLTGWVKNQYDGTVLMEIQGSSQAIDDLIAKLENGMFISIDWMDVEHIPVEMEGSFHVE